MTQIYRFHVNLFADPKDASFACTWEDAATVLEALPGMIFELDGSFVVSGNIVSGDDDTGHRWHVDGHLFDFAGRLHRMELHGECPGATFDELLRCVGWPRQKLSFELVREGIAVDEGVFREHSSH